MRTSFLGVDLERSASWIDGLLDRLAGPSGTVLLYDFARPTPLGTALTASTLGTTTFSDLTTFTDGTVFSGGSSSFSVFGGWAIGADRVLVDGLPAGTTQLLAGDNVGLGGWLYRLRQDAVADGLGRAYLYLNRPLRTAVAHGASITTERPTSPFYLMDDDQAERSTETKGFHRYDLSFIEAI